jgi:hypothetical protein
MTKTKIAKGARDTMPGQMVIRERAIAVELSYQITNNTKYPTLT